MCKIDRVDEVEVGAEVPIVADPRAEYAIGVGARDFDIAGRADAPDAIACVIERQVRIAAARGKDALVLRIAVEGAEQSEHVRAFGARSSRPGYADQANFCIGQQIAVRFPPQALATIAARQVERECRRTARGNFTRQRRQ